MLTLRELKALISYYPNMVYRATSGLNQTVYTFSMPSKSTSSLRVVLTETPSTPNVVTITYSVGSQVYQQYTTCELKEAYLEVESLLYQTFS